MDISLSYENEKYIKEQIANGVYQSVNEAINAAINFAINKTSVSQKRIDEFNQEIEKGLNAYEKGDFLDGNIVMDELRKKYA